MSNKFCKVRYMRNFNFNSFVTYQVNQPFMLLLAYFYMLIDRQYRHIV